MPAVSSVDRMLEPGRRLKNISCIETSESMMRANTSFTCAFWDLHNGASSCPPSKIRHPCKTLHYSNNEDVIKACRNFMWCWTRRSIIAGDVPTLLHDVHHDPITLIGPYYVTNQVHMAALNLMSSTKLWDTKKGSK